MRREEIIMKCNLESEEDNNASNLNWGYRKWSRLNRAGENRTSLEQVKFQTIAEHGLGCAQWSDNKVLDLGPDMRFCYSGASAGPCSGVGEKEVKELTPGTPAI